MFWLMHGPNACAVQPTAENSSCLKNPNTSNPTLALGQHRTMQHGGKVLVGRRPGAAVLDQVGQHVLLRRRACVCEPCTAVKADMWPEEGSRRGPISSHSQGSHSKSAEAEPTA